MNRLSNWITLRFLVPLLFGVIFYGGTAQAGELGSAVRIANVGEPARGYVIPVSSPGVRVTQLVNRLMPNDVKNIKLWPRRTIHRYERSNPSLASGLLNVRPQALMFKILAVRGTKNSPHFTSRII
jgi:hypothetical protein